MHELSRCRGVEKLKVELESEKLSHASICAMNVMLLVHANKREGKTIDKEEKLACDVSKLNSNAR